MFVYTSVLGNAILLRIDRWMNGWMDGWMNER